METADATTVQAKVKEYYGERIKTNRDLRTQACCAGDRPPPHIAEAIAQIDDEIIETFYGCGSPIPPAIKGATVLDLGCGTGRDAYICSKLVGPSGHVIGVDMTGQQLAVARRHVDSQMSRFGFDAPNVEFRSGCIENLGALGIADDSVDVVISNCVINLSADKRRVFSEVFRVLKPGGELYFSDVLTGRRVPKHLTSDPVLLGECLAGAMYVEDLRRMLRGAGCLDHRVVTRRPIELTDPELLATVGMIDFHSMTLRAFKLDDLEDTCEDYGQVATYRGTIAESPHVFTLDHHHVFESGRPVRVCGNTAAMLSETRYGEHFQVHADRAVHYGLFRCGGEQLENPATGDGAACC